MAILNPDIMAILNPDIMRGYILPILTKKMDWLLFITLRLIDTETKEAVESHPQIKYILASKFPDDRCHKRSSIYLTNESTIRCVNYYACCQTRVEPSIINTSYLILSMDNEDLIRRFELCSCLSTITPGEVYCQSSHVVLDLLIGTYDEQALAKYIDRNFVLFLLDCGTSSKLEDKIGAFARLVDAMNIRAELDNIILKLDGRCRYFKLATIVRRYITRSTENICTVSTARRACHR